MKRTSPAIQSLAQQLLALEGAGENAGVARVNPVVRVSEKLRVPLAKLAGDGGFSSLLSRALALAKAQIPSLGAVRVEADGTLAGFDEVGNPGPKAGGEGEAALVAELLGLLVTFIGEPLTRRVVEDAW